ncbi:MAG TPA: NfeD family protein [Candidatus Cybelea sp.]|nr:NfeD family protein [Candidatus Cybelea sp.]
MEQAQRIVEDLGIWGWWALGAALMILEVLLPTTLFLWLGVAAFATGLLNLAFPLSWEYQIIAYAALAAISVPLGRQFQKRHLSETDDPTLNRRAEQNIGRTATLSQAIVNGQGRAVLGDTTWMVSGPDLPAGAKVKVTGTDGTMLKVKPL